MESVASLEGLCGGDPVGKPGPEPFISHIHQCSPEEVDRWVADNYRFPPYQYANKNLLVNKSGELRLPSIYGERVHDGVPSGLHFAVRGQGI